MPETQLVSRSIDYVRSAEFKPSHYHCEVLLPAGCRVVFAGEAGAGKSVTSLNLATALADGKDFLGFKIPEPVRVFYLNLEQPENNFLQRVKLIDEWSPIMHTDNLRFATMRGWNYELDMARTRREIAAYKPKVLLLDTMIEMMGDLDENRAGDIVKYFKQVEQLRCSDDMTPAVNHHMNKNAFTSEGEHVNSKYRVRGSGAILASVENCLAIEGLGRGKVKLSSVKLRDHVGMDPVQYHITSNYTLEIGSGELVSIELLHKVLVVLTASKTPLKADAVGASADVSRAQIFRVLRELKARGWTDNQGGFWHPTEAGKSAQSHHETGQSHQNPTQRKSIIVNQLA